MSAPQRIRRQRTRGWRMPEGAVYVGRPTKWGNPYSIADLRAVYPDAVDAGLRRMCVSDFRGLVEGRWADLEDTPAYPCLDDIRRELRGKDLVCWCPVGLPCHADVLLEVANA